MPLVWCDYRRRLSYEEDFEPGDKDADVIVRLRGGDIL
jgi:hypothetical protein